MVSSDSKQVVDQAYLQRLRELELELIKTRNEAEAARLDARAAELELRLSRLAKQIDSAEHTLQRRPPTSRSTLPIVDAVSTSHHDSAGTAATDPVATPADVDSIVDDCRVDRGRLPEPPIWRRVRGARVFHRGAADTPRPLSKAISDPAERETSEVLFDSWQDVRSAIRGRCTSRPASGVSASPRARSMSPVAALKDDRSRSRSRRRGVRSDVLVKPSADASAGPTADDRPRRRRPVVWFGSALFHAILLLVLAVWTLASEPPADQIALSAAVSQQDETAIESVAIETEAVQPTVEPAEPEPVDVPAFDPAAIGQFPLAPPAVAIPTATVAPLADALFSESTITSAALSMESTAEMQMEFCGIEGGGNHFVYLVDSSASMGDAFRSAREALIRSIDLLRPDQRFYVVFFDAEPDYMRVTSADRDDPRSVYATAENKAALRSWAMGIEMDRGRAPYEAIPFAIDLDPDVIFLLSDGEFPERIETLLNDVNRVENLFGDSGPISIVHTIGYHSREGEARMRRIASQNGGRYRYVPAP